MGIRHIMSYNFDKSCSNAIFVRKIRSNTSYNNSFLPSIDLPPTDMTCVYSNLKFIESKAKEHQKVPVCTFDQALWWKVLQVLSSPKVDIDCFVFRLGGMYTIMSFLGCIGYDRVWIKRCFFSCIC